VNGKRFVLVCSFAAWLLAAAHAAPPISFVVLLCFLATCPGAGVVGPLELGEPLTSGVLLVASSFALDALVAETMLYLHVFTGARVIGVLALISVAGVLHRRPAVRGIEPAVVPKERLSAARASLPSSPIELDRSVPVLLVRIGRYPVYHGSVAAIRTFGRAGVPVHAIVEDRFTPAGLSRYLERAHVWPTTGAETDEFLLEGLARIGKRIGGGVLAIPTDDEAAVFLAEHREVLGDWFVYPKVTPDLPRRLASKRGLYDICLAFGIPTPYAFFPQSLDDVADYAARAVFPIVVKNIDPFVRLRRRAVPSTTVVHSAEELITLAATFPEPSTAMFQDYLPRDVAEDWIFHTYCNEASESLVPFTGVKLRSWPPHAGVTTYARIVRNDELEALSVGLCRDIGYRGVADLDWRFDRRDGQYKLVDFNPRMGAQFKMFETESGLDVLRAMHLDLTGREVPWARPALGKGIRIEHLDLPSAFAYRRSHATAPKGAEIGPRAERAWLAADDPLPFLAMTVRFSGAVFSRLVAFARLSLQPRSATAPASRGAAKSVPQTKRMSGPNVPADDSPAKNKPGTVDSKPASSDGNPWKRPTRDRKSRSKKPIESTSTR
jgi:predicted ATP-grasp superfamily ATP-dependent carboligase